MAIDVKPETEQLINEEIRRGHFRSADELIVEGVSAWCEKHRVRRAAARKPRKNLADFLLEPLVHGSDLGIDRQIGRQKDYPREIGLG